MLPNGIMKFTLTPEQFEAKRAILANNGINVTDNTGTIDTHGCVIDYSYDGATLTLTVRSKPWLITEAAIESKLTGFFAG